MFSGKVITCKFIVYQTPFLLTDSAKFNEDDVKFYQNVSGSFENTRIPNSALKTFFKQMYVGLKQPEVKEPKLYYVVLYSGKLIKCNSVQYQSPLIITDSAKYYEDVVELFRSQAGLYANTKPFSLFKATTSFLKAEITGKINLFIEYNQNGPYMNKTYYYNKGFGDLKYVKYKSLKEDLADNIKSIIEFNKIRNKLITINTRNEEIIINAIKIYNYGQ